MFKKEKYYGEVWFVEENKKCFCVLEFIDNKVFLETNLQKEGIVYSVNKIHGVFNGLGYLTFVNNKIVNSSIGIIESTKYSPEYTFISDSHFIETESLSVKEVLVENPEIIKWIWLNMISLKDDFKTITYDDHLNEVIDVKKKNLTIEIKTGVKTKLNWYDTRMQSYGYVKFLSKENIGILQAIELYDTFQKFLYFFNGKSSQFTDFKYKCLESGKWIQLYYNDSLSREKYANFISLNYKDLKIGIEKLLINWYTNDEILFCVDVILENLLSVKISHNRRFMNSIFSFEAFSKRFSVLNTNNPSLEKYLKKYKNHFIEITQLSEGDIIPFIKKIVRTRNYFTHSNPNKKVHFSEFELLYISLLLDFIVGIELLIQLGVSDKNIELVKKQANSIYINMQFSNKMLNQNVFLEDK